MKTWVLCLIMATLAPAMLYVVTATELSTSIVGAVMVAGTVVLSVLGLIVVRRVVSADELRSHHDYIASVGSVAGTLYAVLVAFAIVIAWQQFTATQTVVAQEANAVADLDRMSQGFSPPLHRQIHDVARTYVRVVIDHEWPAMQEGHDSPLAHAALVEMWHIYTDLQPTLRDNPLYVQSLSRLNDLSGSRRVRLLSIPSGVPKVMWILLYGGGVVIMSFCYLYGVQRFWVHAVVTAFLAGMIAFSLFLTVSLATPFQGDVCVGSDAFQFVLEHMGGTPR